MAHTLQWYEDKLTRAEIIARGVESGDHVPDDLRRSLVTIRDAAELDEMPRTEESVREAITHLKDPQWAPTFHAYALRTDWFNNVRAHAIREKDYQ